MYAVVMQPRNPDSVFIFGVPMVPLLRLIGMLAPILGAVVFCFVASVIRSITDQPPASLGIALLAFIAVFRMRETSASSLTDNGD